MLRHIKDATVLIFPIILIILIVIAFSNQTVPENEVEIDHKALCTSPNCISGLYEEANSHEGP
jgi:hypothetical protein